MESLKNSSNRSGVAKLGRYLRAGILYSASIATGIFAASPATHTNYEPAIKPIQHKQHIVIHTTRELWTAEAREVAEESYKNTGQYDIEKLREIEKRYFDYLRYTHTSSEEPLKPLIPIIVKVARSEGVDPALAGIVSLESWGWPFAVGDKGELGLTQPNLEKYHLTPEQYKNIFDPKENLKIGAEIFKGYLIKFYGDVPKALEAYNGGPVHVIKGRVPRIVREYEKHAIEHIGIIERDYGMQF